MKWKALLASFVALVAVLDPLTAHVGKTIESIIKTEDKINQRREIGKIYDLCGILETVGRSKADLIVYVEVYETHPSKQGLEDIYKALEDIEHGVSWLSEKIRSANFSNVDLSLRMSIQAQRSVAILRKTLEHRVADVKQEDLEDLRTLGNAVRGLEAAGLKAMKEVQAHLDHLRA